MLKEIRDLLVLQDRDRRILTLKKDLEKLPHDELRAKNKLAGDLAAQKKAHDELLNAELKIKKIELDAETRRTTIKRLKHQQFETKKNDEFQALGHEIIRYEKDLDDFETKELEAMEEVDAYRKKLTDADTSLKNTQKLVDEDLAQIAERKTRIEAQIAELNQERIALVAPIPEKILPLYDRLMKNKSGLAIASLHDGKCTGCHMKVIASTAIAVQSAQVITQCENCGRILSIDE